jgi:two-component system sensor histidine kinase BaeS
VPLTGIALLYFLETQVLLTSLSEELSQQARLIAHTAYSQSEIWDDIDGAQTFVGSVSAQVSGQVQLLLPSGQLLASSDPDDSDVIGQLQQLSDATKLQAGESIAQLSYSLSRLSATVAAPVLDIDDQLIGIVRVTHQLEGVSSQLARLRWYVFGVLIGELALGGLVGLALALRLEEPIRSVTSAVTDIARGQPFETIHESGPEEVRLLVQAVNMLAQRLHNLEETRRRLLANLVHELGRPLGALRSAIHVLRHGEDDAEIRQELLAGMETEIERLQPLLDDLTQLHSQVLGTLELDRETVSIDSWLPAILAPWQVAAEEKGLTWQEDLPADLPVASIDCDKVARAIGNLLSNALKYTPAGGVITVSTGADTAETWIRVSDTGAGIPEADQEHIFDPFYRGQQRQRFPKGLGLGLTIAQEVVTAHNGRITLDSVPGQGSHFTIYLPLSSS